MGPTAGQSASKQVLETPQASEESVEDRGTPWLADLGQFSIDQNDPLSMQALLDAIKDARDKHAMTFQARPIPTDFKSVQLAPRLANAIRSFCKDSCRSCLPLLSDLTFFQDSTYWAPGAEHVKDLVYARWDVNLGDLAEAALPGGEDGKRYGCLFCAYIACKMFNDPMYSFWFSANPVEDSQPLGCCSQDDTVSKEVKDAVIKLRNLAGKYGTDTTIAILVRPIDTHVTGASYGSIRLQARTFDLQIGPEVLRDILGMRRELVLDVFEDPCKCLPTAKSPSPSIAASAVF